MNDVRDVRRLVEAARSRRSILKGAAAAAGLALAGGLPGRGLAQATPETESFAGRQMTFASWGGTYQEVQQAAFGDPFAEATGATVLQDGPVDAAKIRAMVEGGSSSWDVVDVEDSFLFSGLKDDLFEPIDYSVVDRAALIPEYTHDYGVGSIVWCYVLTYNTDTFGDNPPQTWADLFDLENFPGKRTLIGNTPAGLIEVALLADGVAPDELYPLDFDRAFAKLDTIKSEVIWWETNAQAQQLFVDGEVELGMTLNGRAYDMAKQGVPIAAAWEGNLQGLDYFIVPRGAENADVAMAFIDFASRPEGQAMMANELAYAPTNPAAFDLIDPEVAPWLPTAPENVEKGILMDAEFWQEHLEEITRRWTEWVAS